ncbi:MAG: hypothetical protein R3C68_18255 [Myxococcota bacterium]
MHPETTRRVAFTAIILASATVLSGCPQWFSGKVANGVARLSVRNTGAMMVLITNDTRCGFDSPQVKNSAVVVGPVGGQGQVTWKVRNCTLNYPEEVQYDVDCNGVPSFVAGRATIDADRVVVGRITGDPDTPVVPEGPDSVELEMRASFDNFRVRIQSSGNRLVMKSGEISLTAKPRMAASDELGVCAVVTPNVTFENIIYNKSMVYVITPERSVEVAIDHSNFDAQSGRAHGLENFIEGRLSVWGRNKHVKSDAKDGLDPDYDFPTWENSYSCDEDLAFPARFDCDAQSELAKGAGRLSVLTLTGIIQALEDDTRCGFSSQAVEDKPVLTGKLGEPGGSATYQVDGCVLDFPTRTVVSTNCDNENTYVQGRAVVTAVKRIREGYVSGDPAEPLVPTERDTVIFEATADLQDWIVSSDGRDQFLKVRSGRLTGALNPRLAIDDETGACSLATPVASFPILRWRDADVRITSGERHFDMMLNSADMQAVNGARGSQTNSISGVIVADHKEVRFADGGEKLVSDYSQPEFEAAAYACETSMRLPRSKEECSFKGALAEGAARWTLKAFGNIANAFDKNTQCGFKSVDGILPATLTGTPGGLLTGSWNIDCYLDGRVVPFYSTDDCNDKTIDLWGTARVIATKNVTGLAALDNPPLYPQDRESAHFEFDSIQVHELAVIDFDPHTGETGPYLLIHEGTLSGIMRPITGESKSEPGAFFIPTSVAGFENIRISNARVTVYAKGKQFNLFIEDSNLHGFNGRYKGRENELSGTITINNETYRVPIDPRDTTLDPDYDPETFTAGYLCADDLLEVIPNEEDINPVN